MDVPQLTEDEMAAIKKDVLTRMRHYLCDKIRAERHLDYLRSRRILSRDDAEEIGCRSTQTKRTATLLDTLAENPRGLDALIDALRESRTQNFIITKITDEVQKAKNEKVESLRSAASSSSPASSLGTLDAPSMYSNNSTLLLHPDGESSPCASDAARALGQPSAPSTASGASIGAPWSPPHTTTTTLSSSPSSSSPSSSLPRPGDPGAPPLPEEVMLDPPSNVDGAAPRYTSNNNSSSSGDPNFQPLRSRSLTPTSHRSVF
ncbi:B-cell lymphoma/leukemia 10 isoform X2 [Pungitius pungitius]|uniref:B-cell lymphoma/leukemia 10 isoform X2 n=1 Tax=Pungitius pungitius TaxID=134920 RepID=UPI002E10A36D